jgi:hypothetical protein
MRNAEKRRELFGYGVGLENVLLFGFFELVWHANSCPSVTRKKFLLFGFSELVAREFLSQRLWSSGYDWTLPTSRPGFDSRQTQISWFCRVLGDKKLVPHF